MGISFKLKTAKELMLDPETSFCNIGYLTGFPQYMQGDLVIYAEGITPARMIINHNVLIKALLSNQELLRKFGILVLEEEKVKKQFGVNPDVLLGKTVPKKKLTATKLNNSAEDTQNDTPKE